MIVFFFFSCFLFFSLSIASRGSHTPHFIFNVDMFFKLLSNPIFVVLVSFSVPSPCWEDLVFSPPPYLNIFSWCVHSHLSECVSLCVYISNYPFFFR